MTNEAATPPASETEPKRKFRVVIHRDVEYEAETSVEARRRTIEDLNDNLETPGTNDDVYEDGGGPAFWIVEGSHGGIPEEPVLFYDTDAALRHVAGLAADAKLDPTEEGTEANVGDDGGYLGDYDADEEVRWWRIGEPTRAGENTAAGDLDGLDTKKAVLYGTVLGYLKGAAKVANP